MDEEWTEIAEAYDRVITKTPNYHASMEKLIDEVEKAGGKRVLDLGCGTGELLVGLTNKDYGCVGIDANQAMVDRAERNLLARGGPGLWEVARADGVTYRSQAPFDVVVSHNVLFNLEEDMRYLDTCLAALRVGGSLVIASPSKKPDFKQLKGLMSAYFQQAGSFEEHKGLIDTVFEVNENFETFNVYNPGRLATILTEYIGFESILTNEETYVNNFVITARKGEDEPLRFTLTDDDALRRKGFGLRYHWLHDRYRSIPSHQDHVYIVDGEWEGVSAVALGRNDRVRGFINSSVGPDVPVVNRELYDKMRSRFSGDIAQFNAFVVSGNHRGRTVGMHLGAMILDHLSSEGFDAVFCEGAPTAAKMMARYGGSVSDGYRLPNGLEACFSVIPLQEGRVKEAIAEHLEKGKGRFGGYGLIS